MNKLLWLVTAILILLGPIIGIYLGIHPVLLPVLGILCGLVAVVRGARALPGGARALSYGGGSPSTGADADARILCDVSVDHSPKSGIGITDVGGAA